MAQVINTNIASLTGQRHLSASQGEQQQALERLSSGKRINSAADDAAGLAISERFTSQIGGMNQAERNANDGISYAQTAEGAMEEMGNLLQRVRELAVQSANDTNTAEDRQALEAEVQQAVQEIDRIASSTQFNNQNILDGSLDELVFQVGANRAQSINTSGVDVRGHNLGAEIGEGQAVQRVLDEEGNYGDLDLDGSININGLDIDVSGSRSVSDAMDAINAQSRATGVTAFRADRATTESFDFNNDGGASLEINGTTISVGEDAGVGEFVDEVNAASGDTGVRAEMDGDQVRFVSESDFRIEPGDDSPIGDLGLEGEESGMRFERGIQLSTDLGQRIDVNGDADTLGALGMSDEQMEMSRHRVSGPDALSVATRTDADDAIRTVDFALGQINDARADLGAVQNRFEATTSNLQNVSENMEASRSRILDADFAAETAAMTRAQVLQQAGTSVLAQANEAPQNVLTLLQ
ncbi:MULTISPECIES: flagellin N-terminal helical domain-containing protein [unclassified Halorhodospira]|uniref:flagellin N-terminal helical domain-containing protein n=1 Tax=unclassified Halorhodospira TaxID=2626748 RepID=UPI001EE9904C|nr:MULTISPECIES: flagellin [unclassified Halorhodospira]MCG5541115.1 flagellin [Halorhodospira sp. M39old]MCG5545602.1 flagellin [Halorhodospira sp. M38]